MQNTWRITSDILKSFVTSFPTTSIVHVEINNQSLYALYQHLNHYAPKDGVELIMMHAFFEDTEDLAVGYETTFTKMQQDAQDKRKVKSGAAQDAHFQQKLDEDLKKLEKQFEKLATDVVQFETYTEIILFVLDAIRQGMEQGAFKWRRVVKELNDVQISFMNALAALDENAQKDAPEIVVNAQAKDVQKEENAQQ